MVRVLSLVRLVRVVSLVSVFPEKKFQENPYFPDLDTDFQISVHGVVMGVQDLPTFITYSGSLVPMTLTYTSYHHLFS